MQEVYSGLDCWMLWQRSIEEAEFSKQEIVNFISYQKEKMKQIQEAILDKENMVDSFSKGCKLLMKSELERIKQILKDSLITFGITRQEDFQWFSQKRHLSDIYCIPEPWNESDDETEETNKDEREDDLTEESEEENENKNYFTATEESQSESSNDSESSSESV